MSRFVHKLGVIAALLSTLPTTVIAADRKTNWYCPYTADGACVPKRNTYGYTAPKWHRWPGVVDQETPEPKRSTPPSSTELEPGTAPTPANDTPTESFPETPLPSTDMDLPPAPPAGAEVNPTPAPEFDTTTPAPPGEDPLRELMPDETKTPPAAEPSPTKPSDNPLDGSPDPFKDDPLFQDEAPKPPAESSPKSSSGNRQRGPTTPVMRNTPERFPTVKEQNRQPSWRLSKTPVFREANRSESVPTIGRPSGQAERPLGDEARNSRSSFGNPLRGGSMPALVAVDREVVRAAEWETVTVEPGAENPGSANPLRRR